MADAINSFFSSASLAAPSSFGNSVPSKAATSFEVGRYLAIQNFHDYLGKFQEEIINNNNALTLGDLSKRSMDMMQAQSSYNVLDGIAQKGLDAEIQGWAAKSRS